MLQSTLLFAVLLSVASAGAGTILNENFDELSARLGVTAAGAFTAADGTNIDVVGNADGFGYLCAAPESGNCLDLDGTGGNSEGILQSALIMLDPGVDYFLSYDLIGSNRGLATSASVTFGSYSATYWLASGDAVSGIVTNALITVGTETAARLTFASNTPGNIGSVLDNVILTSAVNPDSANLATPEPPDFMLMLLLGPGAVVASCRKRSARSSG
jgi:hypothetical protein